MDYGKLLDRQLTNAFKKVDSLLIPATFHLKEGESFNFNTADTEIAEENDFATRVFVMKTTHQKETIKKQILMKHLEGLDLYDSVTLEGQEWSIGATIVDYEHMQIIEVVHG